MSQFVEEDRAATTFRINREAFTSPEIPPTPITCST
jgi:hypothetical protein